MRFLLRPRGFTLIELLVVVAVLSAASLLAFGTFSEDRAQIRYDDTRTRMKQLRIAVLGASGPATSSAAAGYVADNGSLPDRISGLLSNIDQSASAAVTPVFDPVPDSNCANNGSELAHPFGNPASADTTLIKGHRGDYLGGLAFNGRFRDGWGNVGLNDDATNFGWAVALTPAALSISSLGADNVGGGSDYAADQTLTITSDDWQVALEGWSVTVRSITDLVPTHLSLSLLVFRNDADGGHWLRYSTAVAEVCLDGDKDGLVDGKPCPASHDFSFTANCRAGDNSSGSSLVPQGRHLLVVTRHDDTALWQVNDRPFLRNSHYTLARIDAIAGRALPALALEIR